MSILQNVRYKVRGHLTTTLSLPTVLVVARRLIQTFGIHVKVLRSESERALSGGMSQGGETSVSVAG